ncbi:MAG: 50S ribosomal protein L2 [Candidatus Altiarchaeota archaeon]
MPNRNIPQRRGRGTPRYRSPSHRFKGEVAYPRMDYNGKRLGQILEFINDPGRTAPLANIMLDDFTTTNMIAAEGLHVGQTIELGSEAKLNPGNVLPLIKIPAGTDIYNIENKPGDGGKMVRTAGTSGSVVAHDKLTGLTQLKLPSKKIKFVRSESLASVGRVAAGGRKDKPMLHAGQNFYPMRARGKLWPVVVGRAKNAVDHKHGGGRHPHVGRPTTVSRNAPPGRKVGHIAARRTGLKKKG